MQGQFFIIKSSAVALEYSTLILFYHSQVLSRSRMKQHFPLKNAQQEKRIYRSRVLISMGIVIFFMLLLVSRYAYLQLFNFESFTTASDENRIRLQPLPPARGYIYDRNGVLLADNYPVFTATLSRADVQDIDQTLERLKPILELTEEDLERFQTRIKTARKTERVSIKLNLNENDIARFSEVKYQFPGVNIQTQMTRYYPHGDLFAHVIGYVGRINDKELKSIDKDLYAGTNLIGKIGVEKSYEELLHGVPGNESVEADAFGNVLRHLGRKDPVRGNDLFLSLDYDLQVVASEQLAGRRGAIVAMNPKTGEILALVSSPSFNPNLFVTGISFKAYAELRDSIDRPLFNRVLRGLYPPGSTIKPAVAIAGLDAGVVTASSRVYDPGYYMLPNYDHKYRNWNRTGDGYVDLDTAIMRSNDTYFYDLAHKLGIDRLSAYMGKFGLGQKVSLDMFEESPGLMPSREWKRATRRQAWFPGETLILGIGQGYMQATPLQLAQATALVA